MCPGAILRTASILILCGLLVFCVNATLAGEEYPSSRLGVRSAPLLLLSRPDVRADVSLSPEQVASAERILSELHAKAAALKGKTGPEILAARRSIDEAQERWLDTQLSEQQQTRLIQIDLQWEGPAALVTRPVVAESLGLSSAQRSALKHAVATRNRRREQGTYQPSDERLLAEQALAVLSVEQKARWRAMLGRPFIPQAAAPHADPSR